MAVYYEFEKIKGESAAFFGLFFILLALVLLGAYAFWLEYTEGKIGSGLSNQVAWGLMIANVVYLIGASAGSLIISALAGVFGAEEYKPLSRIAAYLAALMIIGALLSIFIDIGRIEHALNVVRYFNPTSIFAWNAFLYTSYLIICIIYLIAQFEKWELAVKILAAVAVIWAIFVHSGTGAIIGFIYSVDLWHSPLTPPLFIISAIASGIGIIIPVLILTFRAIGQEVEEKLIRGLSKIMLGMVFAIMYCFAAEYLTLGYVPAHKEALNMLLFSSEYPFSFVFWVLDFGIGLIIPAIILLNPRTKVSPTWVSLAGLLVAAGVYAERYILIVPGLAYPKEILPGMIMSHEPPFELGASYIPSWIESAEVIGIFALIFLAYLVGLKVFSLIPKKVGVEVAEE